MQGKENLLQMWQSTVSHRRIPEWCSYYTTLYKCRLLSFCGRTDLRKLLRKKAQAAISVRQDIQGLNNYRNNLQFAWILPPFKREFLQPVLPSNYTPYQFLITTQFPLYYSSCRVHVIDNFHTKEGILTSMKLRGNQFLRDCRYNLPLTTRVKTQ